MRRLVAYLFVVGLGVVVFAGYKAYGHLDIGTIVFGAEGVAETSESEEAVPVEIVTVRKGAISSFISSTANLKPNRQVEVVSRTEGVLLRILVDEGDAVHAGQLLSKLDDTQLGIRLQSAIQKLAQAKLQLEKGLIRQQKNDVQIQNTKEDLSRYERLYEEKLVSEREVAQLRYRLDDLEHDLRVSGSEADELQHKVEELEAEIQQAQLEISRTEVRAPFKGIITRREVELGQAVRNLDPLFELGDLSPLEAEVFLSEREAARVKTGQTAQVVSGVDDLARLVGTVSGISPIVDQSSGTVRITVEVPSSGMPFKPGAFVRIDLSTDTREDTLMVPKRALLEEEGGTFVFVADGNRARRVAVQTGYEGAQEIEVSSGLTLKDRVVVAGQGALEDGSEIAY